MPRDEELSQDRAKVLAAAHAAASWVRARRATWTDAPLLVPEPAPSAAPLRPDVPPPLPAARESPAPIAAEEGSPWRDTIQPAMRRWAPRAAAVLLLAAAVGVAVRYGPSAWKAASSAASTAASRIPVPTTAPASAPRPSVAPPPAAAAKPIGSLNVVTTPPGARVVVDGTVRGVTPLTLEDVPVGRHTVVLESSSGTIQRIVAVAPGVVTDIDESIFSGWVVVFAPFEVAVTEGARAFRPDDRGEIMLPAGPHELRLSNRALGFEEIRRVSLKPGERVTLSIKPQRSTMTVTATERADVWLDGTRLGETPLADAPVDLGTHELLLRRSSGGDRRMTIRATVQPVTIHVDFSKPQ